MNSEKSYVNALRVFLCIILFFALIAGTNCFCISRYIISPDAMLSAIDFEEIFEEIEDDIEDEMKDEGVSNDQIKKFRGAYESVFSSDVTEYYIKAYFNAFIYGNDTYDSDEMYELLVEATEDYFDDNDDFSKQDVDDFLNDMMAIFDASIDEALENNEKEEMVILNRARDTINKITTISLIVGAVCIAIMIFTHSNKGIAIKGIGKAGITAQIFTLVGIWGLYALFTEVVRSSPEDPFFNSMFVRYMNYAAKNSTTVAVVVLVISICLVVGGNVLAKGFSLSSDDDYDDDYRSPYEDDM